MRPKKLLNPAAPCEGVASTQHHARRMNARSEAAIRIQRLFRGWRTRQRVVRHVRDELSAFMAAMEQDVEVERLLLGLPKPQTSRWLPDAEDSRSWGVKRTLHLPRIEDNVFGLRFSFPLPVPKMHEGDSASLMEESTHDSQAVEDAFPEERSEHEAVIGLEAPAIGPPLVTLESTTLHNYSEDASPPSASGPAEVDEEPTERSAVDFDQDNHSAELVSIMPDTESPISSHSEVGSMVATEEPQSSGITVEQILATHTKADIQMELQWAKQALRDRLRYLNARLRSQP